MIFFEKYFVIIYNIYILMKDTEIKEIRVKLQTDIKEIKSDLDNKTIVLKTNLFVKDIINLVKKLSKDKFKKGFLLFVNDSMYANESLNLIDFLNEENISTDEKQIEILVTEKKEEPKLIDSKKQDEYTKKIVVNNSKIFVGMFNSEINVYDYQTKALKLDKKSKFNFESNDCYDYNFLNDLEILQSKDNEKDLLVLAIRDCGLHILEITETSINNSIYKIDSSYERLSTNPKNGNIFAAGKKNGEIDIYNISLSKNSKKGLLKISPEFSVTFSKNQIGCISWINDHLICVGDIDSIYLINSDSKVLTTKINTNHHYCTDLKNIDEKLISTHDNGSFKIWDYKNSGNLIINNNKAHQGFISNVLTFENKPNFITSGYDGYIKFWDLRNVKTEYQKIEIENKKKIFSTAIIDDSNNYRLAVGVSDNLVHFYDINI